LGTVKYFGKKWNDHVKTAHSQTFHAGDNYFQIVKEFEETLDGDLHYVRVIQNYMKGTDRIKGPIFVLFNCGSVGYYHGDYTNKLCDDIFDYVFSTFKAHKIVLCGFSMGCVQALKCADRWIAEKESFFSEHVYVVGIGPYKCSEFTQKMHNYKTRMFIYIAAELNGTRITCDSFCNKGNGTLPVFAATVLIKTKTITRFIPADVFFEGGKMQEFVDELHSLQKYRELLSLCK
jgi:hypothetical protein